MDYTDCMICCEQSEIIIDNKCGCHLLIHKLCLDQVRQKMGIRCPICRDRIIVHHYINGNINSLLHFILYQNLIGGMVLFWCIICIFIYGGELLVDKLNRMIKSIISYTENIVFIVMFILCIPYILCKMILIKTGLYQY